MSQNWNQSKTRLVPQCLATTRSGGDLLHLRPFQRLFNSMGLTNRFSPLRWSDQSSFHNATAVAGPLLCHYWNPCSAFPGPYDIFLRAFIHWSGTPYGGFQIAGSPEQSASSTSTVWNLI